MNNRQGTINEQLSYWKGQKKHLNNEGAYDYKLNCNPKGASPILDQNKKITSFQVSKWNCKS